MLQYIFATFLFVCIAYGQASPDCGVGDVTVEDFACTIGSDSCSQITSLRVKDSGKVVFSESCSIPGEIYVGGEGSQVSFSPGIRVEAGSYVIDGGIHSFDGASRLRAPSCRIVNHSTLFVPGGAHFECDTMLVDKTSSIVATGLQYNGEYIQTVPSNPVQVSVRSGSLILLGSLNVGHTHFTCSGSDSPCDNSLSVHIASKDVVFGPTTKFGAATTIPSEQYHSVDISIASDSTSLRKWQSLFRRTAFRGLSGVFSLTTTAGAQYSALLNPKQPDRSIALEAPAAQTNHRRVIFLADADAVDRVVLKDVPLRTARTPKVAYYIANEAILSKLAVECNVEVHLLPLIDVDTLLGHSTLNTLLHESPSHRIEEGVFTSLCTSPDASLANVDSALDKNAPAARSLQSGNPCTLASGDLKVDPQCDLNGSMTVGKILNFIGTLYIMPGVELTVNQDSTFISGKFHLKKNSRLHFNGNAVFTNAIVIIMEDGSSITSDKRLDIGVKIDGEGHITIKAEDLSIQGGARIKVVNSDTFISTGTPPNYRGQDSPTYSGGCHTGLWDGSDIVQADLLMDAQLKGRYLYGSVMYPTSQGSDGARDTADPTTAGRGGGAIELEASNEMELEGVVDVSGEDNHTPAGRYGGGGAGGSILIKTKTLVRLVSSRLRAKGGHNGYDADLNTSGSGGRIALHCNNDHSGANYLDSKFYFDVSSFSNAQGTVWINCGRNMNTLFLPGTGSYVAMDAVLIDASEFENVIIRRIKTYSSLIVFRMEDNTSPLFIDDIQKANPEMMVVVQVAGPGGELVLGAKPVITNTCYSYTLAPGCKVAVRSYMELTGIFFIVVRGVTNIILPEYLRVHASGRVALEGGIQNLKGLEIADVSVVSIRTGDNIAWERAYLGAGCSFMISYTGDEDKVFNIGIEQFTLESHLLLFAKRVRIESEMITVGRISFISAMYTVTKPTDHNNAGSLVGMTPVHNTVPSSLSTDIEYPRTPGVAFGALPFLGAGSALEIETTNFYFMGTVRAGASALPAQPPFIANPVNPDSSSGGSLLIMTDYFYTIPQAIIDVSGTLVQTEPNVPNSGGRIAVHVRNTYSPPRGMPLLPDYRTFGQKRTGYNCLGASGTVFLNGDGIERLLFVPGHYIGACNSPTIIGLNSDFSVESFFASPQIVVIVMSMTGDVRQFKVTRNFGGQIAAEFPGVVNLVVNEPYAVKSEWNQHIEQLREDLTNEQGITEADINNMVSNVNTVSLQLGVLNDELDTFMHMLLNCRRGLEQCGNNECDEVASDFMKDGKATLDITVNVINRNIYNSGNLFQLQDAFCRDISDRTNIPLDMITPELVSQKDGVINFLVHISINTKDYTMAELANMEVALADVSPIHCTGFIST